MIEFDKLHDKFSPVDIEWRIQQAGWKNDQPWAMVLAYVTNRAVMNRLDEVCKPENWQNVFVVESDHAITCGLGIRVDEGWVWKYDAAEPTDIEAIKGGRSGATKRTLLQSSQRRERSNLGRPVQPCTHR